MARLAAFVLALVLGLPASGQVATVRATLDLRQPIADGWLDPEAETVGLRGNRAPLAWDATLAAADPDGDGIYTVEAEVPVAASGTVLELKIKVDGPGNPNDGWQEGANREAALRPGETVEIALAWADRAAPPPSTLTGRFDTVEGVEAEGLAPRDVYVWLPPGYDDDPARRYPVLYLHDGQAMFGHRDGNEWGMDEAATALIEAGEIEPLILVGVANTGARTDEYTPTRQTWDRPLTRIEPPVSDHPALGPLTGAFVFNGDVVRVDVYDGRLGVIVPGSEAPQDLTLQEDGRYLLPQAGITFEAVREADGSVETVLATKPPSGGQGDAYGRLLTDTLKPLVDARYRTRPEAAHTGIGGSSLGGLISMHLGLTRPDVFGRLLVASPSVWWDGRVILQSVAEAAPNPEQRVWIDMGLEEGESMVPDARALYRALLDRGWDPDLVTHVEAEGAGHETRAWQARAPDMLRFLFPPEAE
ncbi:MAG: alpha/beta hydrolase-fold protein [Bacteroidota bacterium]